MSEDEIIVEPSSRAERLDALLLFKRLAAFGPGSWLSSLPSALTILLLYFSFRDVLPGQWFGAWAVATLILAISRTLLVRPMKPASEKRRMVVQWRLANISLLLGGFSYALIFPVIARHAEPEDLFLLGIVGATVFTSVLLMHRTAPTSARIHIIGVGASLALSAWIAKGDDAAPLIAIIVLYGLTLLGAVLVQERSLRAAARAEIDRDDAEHTVRVLLTDYQEQSSEYLWTVDRHGLLRDVSHELAAALELPLEEIEGQHLLSRVNPGDAYNVLAGHLASGRAFREVVVQVAFARGNRYWRLSARPLPSGGLRGVARDVTLDRLTEERVAFMAHFDSLTGLANRYRFHEHLSELMGDTEMRGNVALFCLDLDDFKGVNDARGHGLGDRLLREVGARLEQEVRGDDLVSRLGGDEFAILIETSAGDDMLVERAERFLSAIRIPIEIDGQLFRVSTSIGIARCREGDCDAQELMRRADLALFAAKAKGRDRFAMFEPALDHAARERRELEADLREAVGRGEMRLHYQPVLDLDAAVVTGYEALLRWYHPRRGLLLPGKFLHIAEETGLIVPIGEWIIHEALRETAHWPVNSRIAINLSPTQVRSPRLVKVVEEAMAATGYDPARIEFEITEHVFMREGDAGSATLLKLRSMGANIALDDFGTGYSSLSYLRRFPFDRIKIDRSFVMDVESSAQSQAIVSSITRLADALGMQTTSEGVERREQLDMLRKLGCNEAQGLLICDALQAGELPLVDSEEFAGPTYSAAIIDYRRARAAVLHKRGGAVA